MYRIVFLLEFETQSGKPVGLMKHNCFSFLFLAVIWRDSFGGRISCASLTEWFFFLVESSLYQTDCPWCGKRTMSNQGVVDK